MRRLLVVLVCLTFMLLVACNNGEEASDEQNVETQEVKDELRIAVNTDPPTMDVHRSTAEPTLQLGLHIFEQLFTVDSEFNAVPFLATDFEMSDDGKEYTIFLREGIKFHNGKEMTAEDVVASINKWVEESPFANAAFQHITNIEQIDEYTVLLEFSEPSSVVIAAMANPLAPLAIMPKEIIDSADETGVKEYIGTGPYKFVEWKPDQHIHITRYDDYQPLETETNGLGGKRVAHIKDLYFIPVGDSATKITGLQSGEYDFVNGLSTDNFNQVEESDNIDPQIAEYYMYDNIHLNNADGVFSDVKMRQAVNAALDLQEIYYAAFGNEEFFELDGGLIYPFQSMYVEDGTESYNQHDPEKAKQLLEEVGYDGTPVVMLTTRDFEYFYRMSNVIRSQLEDIGINVDLQVYDQTSIYSIRTEKDKWDMFFTFWPVLSDPSLIVYLDSRNQFPGWYNNPKMDQLLDEMRKETDQNKRIELFGKLQELYWEDVPVIKLGNNHGLNGYNKNLKLPPFFLIATFFNTEWTQ